MDVFNVLPMREKNVISRCTPVLSEQSSVGAFQIERNGELEISGRALMFRDEQQETRTVANTIPDAMGYIQVTRIPKLCICLRVSIVTIAVVLSASDPTKIKCSLGVDKLDSLSEALPYNIFLQIKAIKQCSWGVKSACPLCKAFYHFRLEEKSEQFLKPNAEKKKKKKKKIK